MARRLKIFTDYSLPLELITDRAMILATTGAGKTYLERVVVEEVASANQQCVVLDPKGDFWGLRSSADGKSAGFSIPVFGGEHADLPLEEGSGTYLAELIVRERLSAILDMSLFSKTKMLAWATDFAEALYHRNREAMMLVIDELHTFAPQKFKGHERMLGAFTDLFGKGRKRGIGTLGASQRSALVNKDVLDLTATMFFLRTGSPRDRDVVDDWLEYNADAETRRKIMEDLPKMENGEVWVYSPHSFKILKRLMVREAETFDSSATPKPGQAIRKPKTLAEIDVEGVIEQMQGAVERAKAEDPKELKKQIAQLRKELRTRPTEKEVETKVKTVEVPVFSNGIVDRLDSTAGKMADVGSELVAVAHEVRSALEDAARLAARSGAPRQPQKRPEPRPAPRARTRKEEARPPAERDDELHLKAGARRILETYARHHPMKLTRSQLGTLAGFKITGGTFQTYFSQLKREGLVEELAGESWITDEGFDFLGEVPPAPMTTEEILERWRSVLKAGARAMLDVLIEEYPDAVSREELADRVEMTASGGTFQTYVATLRRNGLAEVSGETVRASDTLFMEGATT